MEENAHKYKCYIISTRAHTHTHMHTRVHTHARTQTGVGLMVYLTEFKVKQAELEIFQRELAATNESLATDLKTVEENLDLEKTGVFLVLFSLAEINFCLFDNNCSFE